MNEAKHTPAGSALTALALELFRLNNRLLAAGDRLVAGVGLTSARWKVLGTITAAQRPQPVAWLARDMGGNRQGVQRIVNDLVDAGLAALQPNPHHRRAPLVVLTEAGKQAFDESMRLQVPWINELADGLPATDIETAHRVIAALCGKLEADHEAPPPEP